MTERNIAWAAGLFEGEGCIGLRKNGNNGIPSPLLQLNMTDKDVIIAFQELVGGKIYGPYKPRSDIGKKLQWQWQEGRILEVKRILLDFLPYLCNRRRNKAIEVFNIYYTARHISEENPFDL